LAQALVQPLALASPVPQASESLALASPVPLAQQAAEAQEAALPEAWEPLASE
jgi:hypothetical protein